MIQFPPSFLWGTATSAYQVEGSPLADGAGPSIWHRFAHTPRLDPRRATGDVACDHYRRYRDDVALMRTLGTNAYRFSIAWSRVMPRGTGPVNRAGWTSTSAWSTPCSSTASSRCDPVSLGSARRPGRPGRLAQSATSPTGSPNTPPPWSGGSTDRVKLWTTINEPWVITDGGYLYGALAPGHRNRFEAPIASHHLLRAHAEAVRTYRAEGRHRIGIVVNLEPKTRRRINPDDRAATSGPTPT